MSDRIKLYTMSTDTLNEPEVFERRCRELSEERRKKIDRIRMEQDKKLSLAAGILLDRGLRTFGLKEADTRTLVGRYGKPYFPDHPDIHFSLSHSHEMAMAVFADTEVGCDIEYRGRPNEKAGKKIGQRFFCPEEYSWMMENEDEADRKIRFFRLWTLKESFLKATGWGLRLPMESFCFSFADSGTPREEVYPYREGMVTVSQQVDQAHYEFEEYQFREYSAAVCLRTE